MLILGATGRVATLLRSHWSLHPGALVDPVWVARRRAPGVTHVWTPELPIERLPRCDAVLALWGVVPGAGSGYAANVSLALTAQQIAHRLGADRVLHASSSAVYPLASRSHAETAPLDPRNDYGRSKQAMEAMLAAHGAPRPLCLRVGNVAGADALFTALDRGEPVRLFRSPRNDGPVRSYVRIATLAAAVEALVRLPPGGLPFALNVAEAKPTSLADIVRSAGRAPTWTLANQPTEPCDTRLDTRLLATQIPLESSGGSAESLVKEWQRLKAQP